MHDDGHKRKAAQPAVATKPQKKQKGAATIGTWAFLNISSNPHTPAQPVTTPNVKPKTKPLSPLTPTPTPTTPMTTRNSARLRNAIPGPSSQPISNVDAHATRSKTGNLKKRMRSPSRTPPPPGKAGLTKWLASNRELDERMARLETAKAFRKKSSSSTKVIEISNDDDDELPRKRQRHDKLQTTPHHKPTPNPSGPNVIELISSDDDDVLAKPKPIAKFKVTTHAKPAHPTPMPASKYVSATRTKPTSASTSVSTSPYQAKAKPTSKSVSATTTKPTSTSTFVSTSPHKAKTEAKPLPPLPTPAANPVRRIDLREQLLTSRSRPRTKLAVPLITPRTPITPKMLPTVPTSKSLKTRATASAPACARIQKKDVFADESDDDEDELPTVYVTQNSRDVIASGSGVPITRATGSRKQEKGANVETSSAPSTALRTSDLLTSPHPVAVVSSSSSITIEASEREVRDVNAALVTNEVQQMSEVLAFAYASEDEDEDLQRAISASLSEDVREVPVGVNGGVEERTTDNVAVTPHSADQDNNPPAPAPALAPLPALSPHNEATVYVSSPSVLISAYNSGIPSPVSSAPSSPKKLEEQGLHDPYAWDLQEEKEQDLDEAILQSMIEASAIGAWSDDVNEEPQEHEQEQATKLVDEQGAEMTGLGLAENGDIDVDAVPATDPVEPERDAPGPPSMSSLPLSINNESSTPPMSTQKEDEIEPSSNFAPNPTDTWEQEWQKKREGRERQDLEEVSLQSVLESSVQDVDAAKLEGGHDVLLVVDAQEGGVDKGEAAKVEVEMEMKEMAEEEHENHDEQPPTASSTPVHRKTCESKQERQDLEEANMQSQLVTPYPITFDANEQEQNDLKKTIFQSQLSMTYDAVPALMSVSVEAGASVGVVDESEVLGPWRDVEEGVEAVGVERGERVQENVVKQEEKENVQETDQEEEHEKHEEQPPAASTPVYWKPGDSEQERQDLDDVLQSQLATPYPVTFDADGQARNDFKKPIFQSQLSTADDEAAVPVEVGGDLDVADSESESEMSARVGDAEEGVEGMRLDTEEVEGANEENAMGTRVKVDLEEMEADLELKGVASGSAAEMQYESLWDGVSHTTTDPDEGCTPAKEESLPKEAATEPTSLGVTPRSPSMILVLKDKAVDANPTVTGLHQRPFPEASTPVTGPIASSSTSSYPAVANLFSSSPSAPSTYVLGRLTRRFFAQSCLPPQSWLRSLGVANTDAIAVAEHAGDEKEGPKTIPLDSDPGTVISNDTPILVEEDVNVELGVVLPGEGEPDMEMEAVDETSIATEEESEMEEVQCNEVGEHEKGEIDDMKRGREAITSEGPAVEIDDPETEMDERALIKHLESDSDSDLAQAPKESRLLAEITKYQKPKILKAAVNDSPHVPGSPTLPTHIPRSPTPISVADVETQSHVDEDRSKDWTARDIENPSPASIHASFRHSQTPIPTPISMLVDVATLPRPAPTKVYNSEEAAPLHAHSPSTLNSHHRANSNISFKSSITASTLDGSTPPPITPPMSPAIFHNNQPDYCKYTNDISLGPEPDAEDEYWDLTYPDVDIV
ncbi:hypothetical protein H0H87_000542 [Tephrocybe sp. NHM501043]|nr:hypothetical protein H0H87_000542 [Tephrocybe sp. NHM501043]